MPHNVLPVKPSAVMTYTMQKALINIGFKGLLPNVMFS